MSQLDLIEELQEKGPYDHAVICTYKFDAPFFEGYALRHLKSLSDCETITVAVDAAEYQALCNARDNQLIGINRDYLIQEFSVPGTFHPKLILLVSADHGKLIVSSANFTREGLTTNAEFAATFKYDRKHHNTGSHDIFCAAYRLLRELAERTPNTTFESNIHELSKLAPWLDSDPHRSSAPRFIYNSSDSLLAQMRQYFDAATVDEYMTLSPFFDNDLAVLDAVIGQFQPKALTIVTQDNTTTLPIEKLIAWRKQHRTVKLQVKLIKFTEDEQYRRLHAKLHVLYSGKRCVCLFGSPNCTSAAMLRTSATGNLETGVLVGATRASVDKLLNSSFSRLDTVRSIATISSQKPLPPPSPSSFSYHLTEALYDDGVLRISANKPQQETKNELLLELAGILDGNEKQYSVRLGSTLSIPVRITLDEEVQELIEKTPVSVRIVVLDGGKKVPASGWRWVENIQPENIPIRLSRSIRDAEESPNKFYEVLHSLTERDDADMIISFLEYLSIPVQGLPPRGGYQRFRLPVIDIPVGPRVRQSCSDLRDAVERFFERHLAKLQRHLSEPTIEGAMNFMHILETTTCALKYHWEYELKQLPISTDIIDADAWAEFRDQADVVLLRYQKLLGILADYHKQLADMNPPMSIDLSKTLRERLEDSYDFYKDWLKEVRQQVNNIVTSSKVRTQHNNMVTPPFGPHDTLMPKNWAEYRTDTYKSFERLGLGW